ncbi:hypothetical protein K435DRAFT_692983, partial [Dendrothele bispora CBS 962.96]
STHNTRIERLWVEVGRQFVRAWRAFFFRLEDLHQLDRNNPHHLWILHFLFLDAINADTKTFQNEWNSKPLTGLGHDRSPNEMLLEGILEHGLYIDANPSDDCNGLSVEEIVQEYGIHGAVKHRGNGKTGAGQGQNDEAEFIHPTNVDLGDEEADDDQEVVDSVYDGQFNAPAVKMPRVNNPFSDSPFHYGVFVNSLSKVQEQGSIPDGYGVNESEWENGAYPSFYYIRSGRKKGKELLVQLLDSIWRPRAIAWAQAVDVYHNIMELM